MRINASGYDSKSNTLYIALADGRIKAIANPTTDSSSSSSATQLASIPGSNWNVINHFSNSNILAAGFGNSQGAVYLWNLETGEELNVLRGHTASITGIAFTPDGKYMATASYDGTVRLWNMEDLNTLPIVLDDHQSWVTSIAFTNDSRFIVSGEKDGHIRVFPVDVDQIIKGFCNLLSRDLSTEEWNNYVDVDIPYNPSGCEE